VSFVLWINSIVQYKNILFVPIRFFKFVSLIHAIWLNEVTPMQFGFSTLLFIRTRDQIETFVAIRFLFSSMKGVAMLFNSKITIRRIVYCCKNHLICLYKNHYHSSFRKNRIGNKNKLTQINLD
jgi:hypothetical protein